MAYGITESGFERKTFEVLKQEVIDAHKSALGNELNTSASSNYTNQTTPILLKISELWELVEAVYNANDPNFSSGEALDRMGLLTGTERLDPVKSTVTATVNLDNGTSIAAGDLIASVDGNPDARFVSTELVENTSGITDDFDVAMEAEDSGVVVCNAGTLTVIESPIVGLNSITNALDADLGSDLETDAAYRVRRVEDLRGLGTSPIDAIRSDLLNVTDVEEVFLFENTTDAVDGNGLPAHSFEALVLNGAAQDIVDQIWASKPAGIATYGSSNGSVVDSSGTTQTVYFSRPTEKTLYIDINVTIDADTYPADGADQIKTSVVTFADTQFGVGDDVIVAALYGPIFDISGVEDVTSIKVYDSSSLGSEVLTETNFATHANWDVTGDGDDTGGNFTYTDSTGVGTLTQQSANFAVAATGNRWYAFTYTVSASTGDCAANITTAFATSTTALTLTNGTHTTYVHTKATPGDFVISATSTTGGFTIDDVTLKVLNTSTSNYTIGVREIALIDTSRITVIEA